MPVETTEEKIVLSGESPSYVALVEDDDPVVIEVRDEIAVTIREESVIVIEVSTGLIGPPGPQGPPGVGGSIISVGPFASRPVAPTLGSLYAADDTRELFLYY